MLSHPNNDVVRRTAKAYGITLIGSPTTCPDCELAKSRQKNVPKFSFQHRATKPCKQLHLDISGSKHASFGGAKFWLVVMDDLTNYVWSQFIKAKSDQYEPLQKLLKGIMKKYGRYPALIKGDNSGENMKFKQICENESLDIKFDLTSPNTPQQNGHVERKIAVILSKVRAILNQGGFPEGLRNKLWAEACNHATDLENLLVSEKKPVSSQVQLHGKEIPGWRKWPTFGTVGIIHKYNNKQIRPKLGNRGMSCIFVG